MRGVGPIVSAPSTEGNRGLPQGCQCASAKEWRVGNPDVHQRSRYDVELGAVLRVNARLAPRSAWKDKDIISQNSHANWQQLRILIGPRITC